jgi:hypothetical protein
VERPKNPLGRKDPLDAQLISTELQKGTDVPLTKEDVEPESNITPTELQQKDYAEA